ncbi:MAG: hypothetical protein RL754_1302 [Bacteroidota bacterium]
MWNWSVNQLFIAPLSFTILQMNNGTVKFFDTTKGFGFIKDENGGNEVFVHVTGLIDEISEGDQVEFELKEGKKGMNAVNVKRA